jgi:hypothetical protein
MNSNHTFFSSSVERGERGEGRGERGEERSEERERERRGERREERGERREERGERREERGAVGEFTGTTYKKNDVQADTQSHTGTQHNIAMQWPLHTRLMATISPVFLSTALRTEP